MDSIFNSWNIESHFSPALDIRANIEQIEAFLRSLIDTWSGFLSKRGTALGVTFVFAEALGRISNVFRLKRTESNYNKLENN